MKLLPKWLAKLVIATIGTVILTLMVAEMGFIPVAFICVSIGTILLLVWAFASLLQLDFYSA